MTGTSGGLTRGISQHVSSMGLMRKWKEGLRLSGTLREGEDTKRY